MGAADRTPSSQGQRREESSHPAARIWLLACGNLDRGDDAVGLIATDGLLDPLPASVRQRIELRQVGSLQVEDLLAVPPGDALVILDAVVGVPSGEIVTLDLQLLVHDATAPTPRSTHQVPVDQVLGLADLLRPGLPEGWLLGLGATRFGQGAPLSKAVTEAMPMFRDTILTGLRRWLDPK